MLSSRSALFLAFVLFGVLGASALVAPSFATPTSSVLRKEVSANSLPIGSGWRADGQTGTTNFLNGTLDMIAALDRNSAIPQNGLIERLTKAITGGRIGTLFSTHTGGPPCAEGTFLWGDQCWGAGDCDTFKIWLSDRDIGFNTWCAAHPKACAKLQCSDECAVGPLTDQVIDVALREVGIKETYPGGYVCPTGAAGGAGNRGDNACKDAGSQAIGSVDDYLGSVGAGIPSAWCASFVSWAFEQAGRSLGSCASAGVGVMTRCAQTSGWTVDRTPAPGDIIVWNVDDSNFENDHAGIVVEVRANGDIVTVQGNGCTGSICHKVQMETVRNSTYVDLISVPGVGQPAGCVGGGGGTSIIIPGDPNFPPGSVTPRTHTTCSGASCLVIDGPGIDQCQNGNDCRTSHTTCSGARCIVVPEPGKDECVIGTNRLRDFPGECPLQTHRECINRGLGPQCAVVPGPGDNRCEPENEFTQCGGADIPGSSSEPTNFCGMNGTNCQCVNGASPINPGAVKRFNGTVHGAPGSGHGWAVCGSGFCAVDLNVGTTAEGAYQAALAGVPIYSPINGTVTAVSPISYGTGSCMTISGNNNTAELCHVDSLVSPGATVTAGQQVAKLNAYRGEFGPHLHFELQINGQWVTGDGKEGTWKNQQSALGCSG